MAELLNLNVVDFTKNYVRLHKGWPTVASKEHNKNCFLDCDNKCKVYQARPTHCKTYPDWDQIWASDDDLLKEAFICPGLNKAVETYKNEQKID